MDASVPFNARNLQATLHAMKDMASKEKTNEQSIDKITAELLNFRLEEGHEISGEERSLAQDLYKEGERITQTLKERGLKDLADSVESVFRSAFERVGLDVSQEAKIENPALALEEITKKRAKELFQLAKGRSVFRTLGKGAFATVEKTIKTPHERKRIALFKEELLDAFEQNFSSKEDALDRIHEFYSSKEVRFAVIFGKKLFMEALNQDESIKRELSSAFLAFERGQPFLNEAWKPSNGDYTDDELFFFFQLALQEKLEVPNLQHLVRRVFTNSKERMQAIKTEEHLKDATSAAVKIPRNEKGKKEAKDEMTILTSLLRTPYVLSPRFMIDEAFIETSYAETSSIPNKMDPLTNRKLLSKVIRALCFLHDQRVVHADVGLRNVIEMNQKGFALIDFNLSQRFEKGKRSAPYRRATSPAESAPEISSPGVIFPKSDVFSAAILFYEKIFEEPLWSHQKGVEVKQRLLAGERPDLDQKEIKKKLALSPAGAKAMAELMSLMWSHSPSKRPSARECYFRLNEIFSQFSIT